MLVVYTKGQLWDPVTVCGSMRSNVARLLAKAQQEMLTGHAHNAWQLLNGFFKSVEQRKRVSFIGSVTAVRFNQLTKRF